MWSQYTHIIPQLESCRIPCLKFYISINNYIKKYKIIQIIIKNCYFYFGFHKKKDQKTNNNVWSVSLFIFIYVQYNTSNMFLNIIIINCGTSSKKICIKGVKHAYHMFNRFHIIKPPQYFVMYIYIKLTKYYINSKT